MTSCPSEGGAGGAESVTTNSSPGSRSLEESFEVASSLGNGAVGGDAMIEHTARRVRHHVVRHATVYEDDLQLLGVGDAVDDGNSRLVLRDSLNHGTEAVNRVATREGTGRVGAGSLHRDNGAKCSLATGLDGPTGRFGQNCHVSDEQVGPQVGQFDESRLRYARSLRERKRSR
jgi:hypothetical protein